MFIVIEGIDGCGKTAVASLLFNKLRDKGYRVLLTKEPTDFLAKEIREVIQKLNFRKEFGYIITLLFIADRIYHNVEIEEKLKEGYIVISDRYYHSTYVYEHVIYGVEIRKIRILHEMFDILRPNYTFILDVPPEIAIERLKSRKNKIVYENIEILEKVRDFYLKLKDILPDENIIYLDGTKKPEKIVNEILKIIQL